MLPAPIPAAERLFGRAPAVRASAPGRVNLMGDHTDYNGGFVLPAAIPQRTEVELLPRPGTTVRLWSAQFPADAPVTYEVGREARAGDWSDYVKGMTHVLAGAGRLGGFDARIASTVPAGSGLSSSAALEIAVGRALREAFGLRVDDLELARAARRAENEFVGAPVGIMDQVACSLADTSSALLLDTRTLEYERVPLPSTCALIVIHSGLAHSHVEGGYTRRREECQAAAAALGVPELRDVTAAAEARLPGLGDPLHRRARHVIAENRRVHATADALRAGRLEDAGRLFLESHASLRDDFDVSTPEIDTLVAIAAAADGVFGARLTGGGFGGAVVAIARSGSAAAAAAEIAAGYREATGRPGEVLVPLLS